MDKSESDDDVVKAAIYARTSSVSQRFGYSMDEQVRQCLDRCELQRWVPLFIFRDEAESGKDVDRPMFQQMMSAAEKELFDVVVFWKLDRLSRSLLHVVQLENEFRQFGVALHSVTEQIDTTTSAGRFNFRNIASAAEFERDMISERSQMGLKALAMELKWPNRSPPLGYERTESGKLRVVSEEAKLVESIFNQYIQKRSMPRVAYALNQREIETKAGGEWTARGVGDVLRNELYTGKYAVAGITEQVNQYKIIDRETFDEAQRVRTRFRSKSNATRQSIEGEQRSHYVERVTQDYLSFLDRVET